MSVLSLEWGMLEQVKRGGLNVELVGTKATSERVDVVKRARTVVLQKYEENKRKRVVETQEIHIRHECVVGHG